MTYSPPSGNVTDMTGIFGWLNNSVQGWFFPGVVIAVFVIILVKIFFNTEDAGRAFASASFACMILTVLLRVADLVNTEFMATFIIFTAISVVWMHYENARY